MGLRFLYLLVFLLVYVGARAQIVHIGGKVDKKAMFNATINYPFFFQEKRPYELMLGVDYTTNNRKNPSGLAPQATFGYFIVDSPYKDHLLFGGLTAGYLFDFNKNYGNQFRLTPHIYMEFLLIDIKVGYDYMMPLNKGYPFISLGLGGLQLFRHFRIM